MGRRPRERQGLAVLGTSRPAQLSGGLRPEPPGASRCRGPPYNRRWCSGRRHCAILAAAPMAAALVAARSLLRCSVHIAGLIADRRRTAAATQRVSEDLALLPGWHAPYRGLRTSACARSQRRLFAAVERRWRSAYDPPRPRPGRQRDAPNHRAPLLLPGYPGNRSPASSHQRPSRRLLWTRGLVDRTPGGIPAHSVAGRELTGADGRAGNFWRYPKRRGITILGEVERRGVYHGSRPARTAATK